MADISARAERPSVIRRADSSEETPSTRAQDSIRFYNKELERITGDALGHAVAVLTEQRDEALLKLELSSEEAMAERAALIDEQDRFIEFMMNESDRKVADLQTEIAGLKKDLDRAQTLAQQPAADDEAGSLEQSQQRISELTLALEVAYSENDEIRAEAVRLQGERDEAMNAADDVRMAMQARVDAAKDDAFRIQVKLDEANRVLEDARDKTRDDAFRAAEELDSLRRELDERTAEVRRLRTRLDEEAQAHSRPPPPTEARELEVARHETKVVRKQLIEAKRELSRISRELQGAQSPAPISRPSLSMPEAPNSATLPHVSRADPKKLSRSPKSHGGLSDAAKAAVLGSISTAIRRPPR